MQTENFKTRHNIMGVSSAEAFMNIKGGINNNCKDVYFFRIKGINNPLLQEIEIMDRTLTERMQEGKSVYQRVNSLPRLASIEDADYYSECYEAWIRNGRQGISIKATAGNEISSQLLGNACKEILHLLEKMETNRNTSIEKNLIVKILFWLDDTAQKGLQNWDPGRSMKFVAANISKKQEYLFCCLLTFLGFDVLLLQTEQDIDKTLEHIGLSDKIVIEKTEPLDIPEYEPGKYIHNIAEREYEIVHDTSSNTAEKRGAVNKNINSIPAEKNRSKEKVLENRQAGQVSVVINTRVPERDRRTREMLEIKSKNEERKKTSTSPMNTHLTETSPVNVNSARRNSVNVRAAERKPVNTNSAEITPVNTRAAETNSAQGREMKYEELALLASSVVMIAIHDEKGNVIGTGSGIMIGEGGYILTNNHVASGGRFYSVRIEDEEEIYQTDELIKYNPVLDLAIIRINRRLKPIPIYRGKKELVRGQKVVAIGSPLGLFNSVSDGIISGFRVIDGVDMIQFTAPISHGSSGGAVLNMQGEIIGISTAGIDNGQNINLAVGYEYIKIFVQGFTG